MPNNANDILISLINRAASGIDQAVDFSKAQLPDVIHQLMMWKVVSYSLRICTLLMLLTLCGFLLRKGIAILREDSRSNAGFVLTAAPLGCIAIPVYRPLQQHRQRHSTVVGAQGLAD
ncbi:hypothetical protein QOM18_01635 [Serratia marcescens]|uniref:hypothetical protein n=1 Tax=Serratia marcescens TaxID=615 RepID=UPI0024C4C694|nr:hypothetical protein [Serratia marcescens]MDK1707013.1 hypothetical protein [Serratia marcescens]